MYFLTNAAIKFKVLRQIAKNILRNSATRLSLFITDNFGNDLPYSLKIISNVFLVSYIKQWLENDRISYFDKVWVFIIRKIAYSLHCIVIMVKIIKQIEESYKEVFSLLSISIHL